MSGGTEREREEEGGWGAKEAGAMEGGDGGKEGKVGGGGDGMGGSGGVGGTKDG